MRILLLQARDGGDPMLRHELECFAERCELPEDRFLTLNLAEDAWDDDGVLDTVEAVMVGGSGDYSLAHGGFYWHDHYLDLIRRIVRRKVPMFASCFGFQAIVQAFGGRILKQPGWSEVGTFEITLSEAGRRERVFADAGTEFDAQLGHNDSAAADLPDNLLNLGWSERCPVQAVAVKDAPVVATQFHPELSMTANMVRYINYLHHYDPSLTEAEAQLQAQRIHRPSPVANGLLKGFLERYL